MAWKVVQNKLDFKGRKIQNKLGFNKNYSVALFNFCFLYCAGIESACCGLAKKRYKNKINNVAK
jgi:hypothetical protein